MSEPNITEVINELVDLHELLLLPEILTEPIGAYADDIQDAVALLRQYQQMEHVASVRTNYYGYSTKLDWCDEEFMSESPDVGTKLYALKESSDE